MTVIQATGKSHDLAHFKFNLREYKKFQGKREYIFTRDKWECVKCGKSEIIQYEEVGRTFDCHHINGNVLDNRNSNLETVCSKCHKPIHPNRTWKRFSGEQDNGGEKSIE